MGRLTRRGALAQFGSVAAVAGLPRHAFGDARPHPQFVIVFLRGALDGLAAVPAYGDGDYRKARAGLALRLPNRRNGIIDLNGFFGLHPALAPLHEFYARGELLVLPAVSTACRERSHAAGQCMLDRGTARPEQASAGWLDRALGLMPRLGRAFGPMTGFDGAALDVVANLGHGSPSLTQALAENWSDCGLPAVKQGGDPVLWAPRAQADAFRRVATEAGELLSREAEPRVVVLESYGWDTHVDQGTHDGRLAVALDGLAAGLVALASASGNAWRSMAVLVATEFGRTIAMNSMGGTDHGTASVALLLGGAVAGGRIAGRWPGLSPSRLYQGRDLAPTNDLRAVEKAVLIELLGLPQGAVDRGVFPDSAMIQPMRGLFRV